MNTTITSKGLPALAQPQSGQVGGSASGGANQAAGSGETTAAPAVGGDRVQLTESARALHQAARGDSSSSFDAKRVEQIRQALADGSYRVNPGKIADGLISLEGQLDGKA
jgi:negative regulator of flagellin synthesis FlgM